MDGGFVSNDHLNGTVAISGGDGPLRDPDARCEGCGARGTVGRARRQNAADGSVEEHRYCADCWPEWSAFYRARWQEQRRRAVLAWRDRPRDADEAPSLSAGGMWFESDTWHGVIEFVQTLTRQARYYREPPSAEDLAGFAAGIRAAAANKVGPMPLEVRAFLAAFDNPSRDAPAS
jgi:hypothetical protein